MEWRLPADRESFHEIIGAHYGEEEWERQQKEGLSEVLKRMVSNLNSCLLMVQYSRGVTTTVFAVISRGPSTRDTVKC